MIDGVFTTIAVTGFSVAFMHAAIPTHWLPFVAAGRAQGWTRRRTLVVTAVCGLGQVAVTAVLGALVAWFGIAISERVGAWFPRIAGGALLAFGAFYLWRQWRGGGHSHVHFFGSHDHHENGDHTHDHAGHDEEFPVDGMTATRAKTDWAALVSLFTLLTFSPCEGFLPVYVTGVRHGWWGFALLTLVLSVATVAGMVVFTWLTLFGLEKLNLRAFEKYENGTMGALLCALGVLVIVFEH